MAAEWWPLQLFGGDWDAVAGRCSQTQGMCVLVMAVLLASYACWVTLSAVEFEQVQFSAEQV